jgi:hypothetical protein
VLEYLAADHEVVAELGHVGVGDCADGDAVTNLRRGELTAGGAEVDPVCVDTELVQEEHQEAGPATDVQHAMRLEHLLDQRRVAVLDAPAGLELVPVLALAPVRREVLAVVVVRLNGFLAEHGLLKGIGGIGLFGAL